MKRRNFFTALAGLAALPFVRRGEARIEQPLAEPFPVGESHNLGPRLAIGTLTLGPGCTLRVPKDTKIGTVIQHPGASIGPCESPPECMSITDPAANFGPLPGPASK